MVRKRNKFRSSRLTLSSRSIEQNLVAHLAKQQQRVTLKTVIKRITTSHSRQLVALSKLKKKPRVLRSKISTTSGSKIYLDRIMTRPMNRIRFNKIDRLWAKRKSLSRELSVDPTNRSLKRRKRERKSSRGCVKAWVRFRAPSWMCGTMVCSRWSEVWSS